MSYGNIILTVKCKIQLVEGIVFTEARVVKTTETDASVASNVATAMDRLTDRPRYSVGNNRPHLRT